MDEIEQIEAAIEKLTADCDEWEARANQLAEDVEVYKVAISVRDEAINTAVRDVERFRTALADIKRHVEELGGNTHQLSAVWRIAEKELRQ